MEEAKPTYPSCFLYIQTLFFMTFFIYKVILENAKENQRHKYPADMNEETFEKIRYIQNLSYHKVSFIKQLL